MDESRQASRFATLALPHLDSAYRYARRLATDEAEARDVVQEAYLRAWRYFDAFAGEDAKPWLMRIVRNTFLSSRDRAGAADLSIETVEADLDRIAADAHANGSVETPDRGLSREEARQVIEAAMAALPAGAREVLQLREIEELSYKRIAHVLDLPVGTVMSRLSRARAALAIEVRRRAGTA